jgi:lipoate-protein ligase A
MAIDEAVFLHCRSKASPPTLRFYGWQSPAVSVGYFQDIHKDIDLEACRRLSVNVVRRPTGGKAVFHDGDFTYALVALDHDHGFPPDILGTYRLISRCLFRGLAELGIEADMAVEGRPREDIPAKASCFALPSKYELLVKGRKLCGSAQVRSQGTFLQHGSLLVDFDPFRTYELMIPHDQDRDDQIARLQQSVTSLCDHLDPPPTMAEICRVMKKGFETILGIQLVEDHLTKEEANLKTLLLEQKYQNEEWTLKGKGTPSRSF